MLKLISYMVFAVLVLAVNASASVHYASTLVYATQVLDKNIRSLIDEGIPSYLKYTESHAWVKIEGDIATIGMTDFAQSALGDIEFAEFPSIGNRLKADQPYGIVESIKSVSDLISPLGGVVVKVNNDVINNPSLINLDPYNSWFIKLQISNPAELENLLGPEAYKSIINR